MNKLKSYTDRRWLLLASFCTLVVLVLTHIPPQFMAGLLKVHFSDKLQHLVAYGLITVCFIMAFKRWHGWRWGLALPLGIAVLGVVDELTQPLVNRQASVGDFAADVTGILIVTALWLPGRLSSIRSPCHWPRARSKRHVAGHAGPTIDSQ